MHTKHRMTILQMETALAVLGDRRRSSISFEHMGNPYLSPDATESTVVRSRAKSVVWWLLYLCPVITLTLIYTAWLISFVSLGRFPAFDEHPNNAAAHTAVHLFCNLATVPFLASPLIVPVGMLWSVTQPFAQFHKADVSRFARIASPCIYLLTLIVFGATWVYDPLGTMYWFIF